MPLYRFIVHMPHPVDDPDGVTLPNARAAVAEGATIVRELKRDYGPGQRGWSVEIRQAGRRIELIAFETVE